MSLKTSPPCQSGASSKTRFTKVSLVTLKLLPEISADLYLSPGAGQQPVLYRSSDIECTPQDFQALQQKGVTSLYLRASDSKHFEQLLKDRLESILENEQVEVEDRYSILQTAVTSKVEKAFHLIRPDAVIDQSQNTGRLIAKTLHGASSRVGDLFDLMEHGYQLFSHAMNVSSYAVLLAQQLGIHDTQELNQLAVGAMLHDMGKRTLSKQALAKSHSPHTPEAKLIQSHPQVGYEEACRRSDLNRGQLMMIYQHHERIDGSGYPVGITGHEIHPWAKICSIADVFDSLTSRRPNHPQMTPPQALEHLDELAGHRLDKEMVRCWKTSMRSN